MLIATPRSSNAFNFAGPRWGVPATTFSLNENIIDNPSLTEAIRRSFATWNDTGADFTFLEEATSTRYPSLFNSSDSHPDAHHDIAAVSFKRLYGENDPRTYDTAETMVYSKNINGVPTIIDVDELFNIDYPYSIGIDPARYDAQAVQTHEVGHWVKLEHPLDCLEHPRNQVNPTMCPVPPGVIYPRKLKPDDVEGITHIYGVRNGTRTSEFIPLSSDNLLLTAALASLDFSSQAKKFPPSKTKLKEHKSGNKKKHGSSR